MEKAKEILMIDIYTKKQVSTDQIILNDMYFNVYTGNEEISEYEAKLIQQVDKAKLTTDKNIETRYGTSSITKNFIVSGQRQVEKFANAIEESYQESLHRAPTPDLRITHLRGSEVVKKFMAKRKEMIL